jgi:hypothetical protein
MRSTRRGFLPTLLVLATVLVVASGLAGCGGPKPSTLAAPTSRPTTAGPTPAGPPPFPTTALEPTEVPGGETPGVTEPIEPPGTTISTTQTEWGTIVDALPADFPVFPGAAIAEPPAEPVSGAYLAPAGVEEVATWYRDALEATGMSTLDLSTPLEDGSRILDMQGDLPECLLRVTFRPAAGSTMITVLLAAGCFGGGG